MNTCLNCSNKVSEKAKYCSDKCRMAYKRRTKQGDLPEQIEPEQPTRTFNFKLSRTDRSFEDHKPGYYDFKNEEREEVCIVCDRRFKTRLKLLKYCSRKHMEQALNAMTI